MSNDLSQIQGLDWQENWRIDNGKDSFVVPFATLRPVNLVFHGEGKPFEYGHYGIHLGQGDCLTFLGPSSQTIRCYFIDCRQNSPTLHRRVIAEWQPSSGKALYVPPGVAHAFSGLEGVYTLNTYKSFLPDPNKWLSGNTKWTPESDVVNLPMDVTHEELPIEEANSYEASDVYYQVIAERQRESIPNVKYGYPSTEDISFENGAKARVVFYKKQEFAESVPDWVAIDEIDGLGWARHPVVWSSDDSGFVPLLDARPLYIVDHGEQGYSHDAFGIHIGQQDRLTFVGPSKHIIRITLVDCRRGSKTLHHKISFEFQPSPLRYLVIPNGVAHRFEGLETVFTINRPNVFVTIEEEYEPGNDVIDWPIEKGDFPTLDVHQNPASQGFYARQTRGQRELMSTPPMHSTPVVLTTEDSEGKHVRVAFRKSTSPPS